MKILGVMGSPRKKGNTDILVDSVLNGAKVLEAEIEKIYLSDLNFKGCIGCEGCSKTCKCVLKDDMQSVYQKLEEADGIVLGSPTYFYNVSGLTKMFIDRLYAYEVFNDNDRSVWLSRNEVLGTKYAVTIAVCEQETEDNIGFASDAMSIALKAVGWRTVDNIKALHLFKRGEAITHQMLIETAEKAGEKLAKTILLADNLKVKENLFSPVQTIL